MSADVQPVIAGLIGWPVHQSKSPIIHQHWLNCLRIDGGYIRFPVKPGGAAAALRGMAPLGLVGLQATMPHKHDCFAAIDVLSDVARMLGVVNTVTLQADGRLYGHNTDIAGFLEPLAGVDLNGATVTVLGAGGAAAAIVAGLAKKGVGRIVIVNRSQDAIARLLANLAGVLGGVEILRCDWAGAQSWTARSDLIVNATALGMVDMPVLPIDVNRIKDGATVYDIITHPSETQLLVGARARGLRVIDGLSMLIGQAREAFEMFYGEPAPRDQDAILRQLLAA